MLKLLHRKKTLYFCLFPFVGSIFNDLVLSKCGGSPNTSEICQNIKQYFAVSHNIVIPHNLCIFIVPRLSVTMTEMSSLIITVTHVREIDYVRVQNSFHSKNGILQIVSYNLCLSAILVHNKRIS